MAWAMPGAWNSHPKDGPRPEVSVSLKNGVTGDADDQEEIVPKATLMMA